MSVAAPRLRPAGDPPAPRRARPARRPAARPPRPSLPFPSGRARRGSPPSPAFWVFTAVVVTALVVGIVSLSALLVRTSFRVGEVREAIGALRADQEQLAIELVTASAPSRIATWARGHGMVRAEDVRVLHVRPGAGA